MDHNREDRSFHWHMFGCAVLFFELPALPHAYMESLWQEVATNLPFQVPARTDKNVFFMTNCLVWDQANTRCEFMWSQSPVRLISVNTIILHSSKKWSWAWSMWFPHGRSGSNRAQTWPWAAVYIISVEFREFKSIRPLFYTVDVKVGKAAAWLLLVSSD